MEPAEHGWQDQQIELIIGNLLRAGVLTAAAVVAFGAVPFLIQGGGGQPDYKHFEGEPPCLRNVADIVMDAFRFHGKAVIQLGILLLVSTPVARVLLTVVAFAVQRDWLYAGVTVIVLTVLLVSLFGPRL
jgi:uncharacterized membrane protein